MSVSVVKTVTKTQAVIRQFAVLLEMFIGCAMFPIIAYALVVVFTTDTGRSPVAGILSELTKSIEILTTTTTIGAPRLDCYLL